MPEEEYAWLPRESLLTFEETRRLVDIFTGLGVDKVRLTGGEPLLRRNLPELVAALARNGSLRELALTTNGVMLAAQAADLKAAGLNRITVSLDTLHPDRFTALTRLHSHAQVLAGIDAARAAFGELKIDAVVMRGVNDDEIVDLIEFGKRNSAEVRLIEYMDVGGATQWASDRVVARTEILERLAAHYGPISPVEQTAWAPADRFRLADGTVFGIIASTTSPFCGTCDRARLTADGIWFMCLYATDGLDLRALLRGGRPVEEIRAEIEAAWTKRSDKGAELRLADRERGVFVPASALKTNPHLEMHTRGG